MNIFLKSSLMTFLLFIFSFTLNAQKHVLNFKEPFRLKSLQSIQNNNGQPEIWSVGGQGSLVITTRENRIDKTISKVDLNSIFFVNNQLIFVTGNSGELLVTKNRGENWMKIELDTKVNLENIFCINENKCWIVGANDGILIKGGINSKWNVKSIVSNGQLEDIYFVNDNIGFAVGDDNLLLKTIDGGENWRRISLSYETDVWQFKKGIFWFEAVSFFNENIGCIAGWDVSGGIVACTQNQGKTWNVNLIEGKFIGIVWNNEKKVHLVDDYGKNYISRDAGLNWKPENKKLQK